GRSRAGATSRAGTRGATSTAPRRAPRRCRRRCAASCGSSACCEPAPFAATICLRLIAMLESRRAAGRRACRTQARNQGGDVHMQRREFAVSFLAAGLVALGAGAAAAQAVVKVGMSFSMTGAGFNAAGRQASAGARLYLQQHGNMVAGKKIELILRDDAGVADNARRLVQEMIVNDKVDIIAGGITPPLLAARPPPT